MVIRRADRERRSAQLRAFFAIRTAQLSRHVFHRRFPTLVFPRVRSGFHFFSGFRVYFIRPLSGDFHSAPDDKLSRSRVASDCRRLNAPCAKLQNTFAFCSVRGHDVTSCGVASAARRRIAVTKVAVMTVTNGCGGDVTLKVTGGSS